MGQRLAVGSVGQVLTSDGSDPYWATPASATFGGDAKVVRFTAGSPVTLTDTPDDPQSGVIFICSSGNSTVTLPGAEDYASASSSKYLTIVREGSVTALAVATTDASANDVRQVDALGAVGASIAGTVNTYNHVVKFLALPDGAGNFYWLVASFNHETSGVSV